MTMLGNEFATLMLVSGTDADVAERLADATKRLEWERRLTIFLRPLESEPEPPAGPEPGSYTLTAKGIDKAGIVAGVARCLADHGVLITDLRGRIQPIPQSGTPLYVLSVRMHVAATTDVSSVERSLAETADRLDVEIAFESA